MEYKQIPMGLSMALAQNPEAMKKLANLSEAKKQEIINGTHALNSKEEMQQYVNKIISS